MPSVDVLFVAQVRLATVLAGARAVYSGGVPSGTLPDRYLVVRASVGEGESSNASGRVDMRSPVLYVTSVARATSDEAAAREAAWGSRKAVDALTDWRPTIGQATWLAEHFTSLPPTRDDSLPEPVAYAVDQFVLRYQPT